MWDPPAARDDVRYRSWPIELCMRVCWPHTLLNIHRVNEHFTSSLQDRYEVIYNWPSQPAMRPNVEATLHMEELTMRCLCWLRANMTSESALQAATMITDGLDQQSCAWVIQRAQTLAQFYKYVSRSHKHWWWVKTHTMISQISQYPVSNFDNDVCLVQPIIARLDSQIPNISEVEIEWTVPLWMFLLYVFFFLFVPLLFCIFDRAQHIWLQHGFLLYLEISQVGVGYASMPDLSKWCPEQYWLVVGLMGF